jgi:hypothetical protein
MSLDTVQWCPIARIDKYSPEVVEELTRILGYEPKKADFDRLGADPFAVTEVEGNLITTAGLGFITAALIAGTFDPLSVTRAFVGVGATATAATVADTALGANGGSAYYQAFDGAPTRTTTTVTNDAIQGVSTFASGNANFAWNEWCWASTTTGTITPGATLASITSGTETMWNHKIASMGTKGSGSSWVFTTKVTFS